MIAEIINIGDELLIGQVTNSNAAYLGQQLNALGIKVFKMSSISDSDAEIRNSIHEALNRADLIILTGGLGPTKDDITKKTLAEIFKVGMHRDEKVLQHIQEIFKRWNRPMLDINEQQADIPTNAEVLFNHWGTAPGMLFKHQGKIIVSLPGVPYEMINIFEKALVPYLESNCDFNEIYHRTILTVGIGESFLAKKIEQIEDALPEYIKLAYLPKFGQVRLRISCYNANRNIKTEIESWANLINQEIEEYVIANEDVTLSEALLNFLKSTHSTLSIAESCTGGYISHQLTAIPGASAVFTGSLVPYSNQIKIAELGVEPMVIETKGAVSEEVVSQMLDGALQKFNSDYAIAVSGVAGPDGGTNEKPVGTVYIGVCSKTSRIITKYAFGTMRSVNIERTSIQAQYMLYKLAMEDKKIKVT